MVFALPLDKQRANFRKGRRHVAINPVWPSVIIHHSISALAPIMSPIPLPDHRASTSPNDLSLPTSLDTQSNSPIQQRKPEVMFAPPPGFKCMEEYNTTLKSLIDTVQEFVDSIPRDDTSGYENEMRSRTRWIFESLTCQSQQGRPLQSENDRIRRDIEALRSFVPQMTEREGRWAKELTPILETVYRHASSIASSRGF